MSYSYVQNMSLPIHHRSLPIHLTLTRDIDLAQRFNQDQQLFKGSQLIDSLNDSFKEHSIFKIQMSLPSPPPLVLNIPTTIFKKDLSRGCSEIFTCIDADIPEDSIYRKLLACIPIIGIIPTVLNENSLKKKITETKESNYLIKLINVKNDYKICSIVRELLSLALIVTGIALTILSWPIGIGAGIIGGSCVAFNAYGIYKNKQIINKLQANDPSFSSIDVR